MTTLNLMSSTSLGDFQKLIFSNDGRVQEQENKETNINFSYIHDPKSLCSRIYSYCTGENVLNDKISELIKLRIREHIETTYKVTYNESESIAIEHTFQELLKSSECCYADIGRVDVVRRLMTKIPDFIEMVNAGVDVRLDAGATYILKNGSSHVLKPDVVNIINCLLGNNFDTSFISCSLLKSLFFADNERSTDFRYCLELIMKKIYEKLNNESCDPNDKKILIALLEEIINTIPISEPPANARAHIPQYINNNWVLVEYEIEIVPISSEWFGETIPAYGLKPVTVKTAQPILLFRPTPLPSSRGALVAYAADMVPGKTVGEVLYNRENIKIRLQQWIKTAFEEYRQELSIEQDEKQFHQKGVVVGGKSLGGILAIIAASHQPKYISDVLVSGSPTPYNAVREEYDRNSQGLMPPPNFHQYCNYGDKVPFIGYGFYPRTVLHKVIAPRVQGKVDAHARVNLAMHKAIVVKVDSSIDANYSARKTTNIAHQIFSVLCFPVIVTFLGIALLKTVSIGVVKSIYYAIVKRCFGDSQPALDT
jgi:hypothetical protein